MKDRYPPHVPNAPGVIWRERANGAWECRWQARADIVKKGYEVKSRRLWVGVEPTDAEARIIQDDARKLQDAMLEWNRPPVEIVLVNDGTIAALAEHYRTDPDSPYHKVRHVSRRFYSNLLKKLTAEHGHERLTDIKARTVLHWHKEWSTDDRVSMGHAMVGMLRTIINFGVAFLEDPECVRLSTSLSKMKFKLGKPRNERLTAEQANAIRNKAFDHGRPSLALAQAIQFECMLRQKDVIGEWVPLSEPGVSGITYRKSKWIRGLRWEEIDSQMILRHITSKRQKPIEVPLANAPMVMEEMRRQGLLDERPASGPIIVSEITGLPYTADEFRKTWREKATLAGVPAYVRNMDSRAGAISEATDAGAELEHIRHAATHSDIATTQRYSRGSEQKTATVLRMRVEHRNKKGTRTD